jgi:hypothetical protein
MKPEDIESIIDAQINFLLEANLIPNSIHIDERFEDTIMEYWKDKAKNVNQEFGYKLISYRGCDLRFSPPFTVGISSGIAFPVFVTYTS